MHSNATSKEFASPDNFGIVDPSMTTIAERRSLKARTPPRTIGFVTACSFVIVWVVALFHLINLRVGSAFQNLSTLVKLLLIGAFIAAGFFVHPKQPIAFLPARTDVVSIFGAPFAVALVYVMYSYSGWNAAAYITGEIKRPEKNVPRSLFVGTVTVIVIYVLLNAIFLATTPTEELK